jgi:hypothetical protein
MTTQDAKKLLSNAGRIDPDCRVYERYSGRFMFGDYSAAAVTSEWAPSSSIGKRLLRTLGSVDSLGLRYIYYTQFSAAAEVAG